jgi:hypothetical protein
MDCTQEPPLAAQAVPRSLAAPAGLVVLDIEVGLERVAGLAVTPVTAAAVRVGLTGHMARPRQRRVQVLLVSGSWNPMDLLGLRVLLEQWDLLGR